MEDPIPTKGRKKPLMQLPSSVLEKKDPKQAEELEQGFKILQKLLSARNIQPFLEKPDENECDIMATYYEVIEQPMWFNEVKRKYLENEYTTIPEFVLDVRKIFENCFRFWGPKDHLTKIALRLESILEYELSLLPEDTQTVCSLASTHGFSEEKLVYKKEGVTSQLLQWVINEQSEEEMAKNEEVPLIERKEMQDNLEKEIVSWENGILYSEENVREYINSMWELPQIGQFLSVTASILNFDSLSQFEVERMLLMPQFSKSLAAIMTSFLTSKRDRPKVLYGPPMPYEIWSSRLATKVSAWYKVYYSKQKNFVEVLSAIGIEHMFWLVMGEPNPLERFQFHELVFQKRVWILKTLCDIAMQSQKTIYDLLHARKDHRVVLGEDKKGNTYFHFSIFPDLRVYRQAKVLFTKFNINRWERLVRVPASVGDTDCLPNSCVLPSKSEFEIVATNVDELRTLYTNLIETEFPIKGNCDKNSPLLENIDSLLKSKELDESLYLSDVSSIRQKMYAEWKTIFERAPDYNNADITYWEKSVFQETEKEEKKAAEELTEENNIEDKSSKDDDTQETPKLELNLRERKSKTESHLNLKMIALNAARGESDTSDESADLFEDSEEEWVANSKSKKKTKRPSKRRKTSKSVSQNDDEASEVVEKNIKKNLELEKQKSDDKAKWVDSVEAKSDNVAVVENDKVPSNQKEPIRIKCKDLKSLKYAVTKSGKEPVKVIKNLVVPEVIKAENSKPPSPETINLDDEEDDVIIENAPNDVPKQIQTINLSLCINQPSSQTVLNGNAQMLPGSKSPCIQTVPVSPSPLYTQRPSSSPIGTQIAYVNHQGARNANVQQTVFYPESQIQKSINGQMYPNSKGVMGNPVRPYNIVNSVKNAYPVTKNAPPMSNVRSPRMSVPRMSSPRMMQANFRGNNTALLSPRMPVQPRTPRQRLRYTPVTATAQLRQSYITNGLQKTPPQQRLSSPRVPAPRQQANSFNSTPRLSSSAPSKSLSSILSSITASQSTGNKRRSNLLNSITITPVNNSAVTITPIKSNSNQLKNVSRSLNFSSPTKSKSMVYIKGKIILDSSDYCYSVQVSDGRKFKLTPEQLEEFRERNNGIIPPTISIPVPEDVARLLEPEIIEID